MVSSLAERGRVDLDYMASLYGKTPEQIAKELDGLIFKNPAAGWESRDQYLSGNVKKKLAQAIDAAKAEGKILAPAVETVWRNVGKADVAQLKALIDSTPANPALAGKQQSDNGNKVVDTVAALSNEQLAVCRMLGQKPEDYLATLKQGATA